jgi:hypothetical protein
MSTIDSPIAMDLSKPRGELSPAIFMLLFQGMAKKVLRAGHFASEILGKSLFWSVWEGSTCY